MREIKFRAWWSDPGIMKDFSLGQDYLRGYKHGEKWCLELDDADSIMQYTGLKDKNGKEIYEGDIVLYKKLISVVEWMWYMWIFKHKDMGDMAQDHVVASSHSSVKIIGNIYENPDLL